MGSCSLKSKYSDNSTVVHLIQPTSGNYDSGRLNRAGSINLLFREEYKDIIPISPSTTTSKSEKKKRVIDRKRRASVSTEASNAIVKEIPKTAGDKLEIKQGLQKIFIFQSLSDENVEAIIGQMRLFILEPSQMVYSSGSLATHFFIISKGRCQVTNKAKQTSMLTKGQCFGELALMHECMRNETVYTIDKVNL